MKNKNAMSLVELLVLLAILITFGTIVIANIVTKAAPQKGPALQVEVSAPAVKSELEQSSAQKFICESVPVDGIIASGSEIQKLIVSWQAQNPRARIVSIVPVKKNDTGIGALVISAYTTD